jgi:arylsulfatase A-like enzyme
MPHYNILWITLDSLKASALPSYGNPYCVAPASERVAGRGVVFENAFCQMPKCVPVRPGQLMGRYPHADGLRAIAGKVDGGENRGHFVLTDGMPNIVDFLHSRGYVTCHKGVNHLVDWSVYGTWFDSTTDWEPYKRTAKIPCTTSDEELLRAKYHGPVPDGFDLETTSDAEATRQMCSFLKGHDVSKPFFAYLDIRAPHPAYRDYQPWAQQYRAMDIPGPPRAPLADCPWTERVYRETYGLEQMSDEKWRTIVRAYYSAISWNDSLVHRVLDALAERGLEQSTLVIYTADHGDFAGEHGCIEKHDTILYDCHVHMPLLIQFPRSVGPVGRRTNCMVEMIDLAPTLLDLCGFGVPHWMQGASFADVMRGRSDCHKDAVFAMGGVERDAIDRNGTVGREFFFGKLHGEYHLKQKVILDHPEFMMRAKMIRTRDHKLIYRLNGHHELYDLREDPHELANQFANPTYAGTVTELKERLIWWLIESETNLPLIDKVWA